MNKRKLGVLAGIITTTTALYEAGMTLFISLAFDRKPLINLLGSGNHHLEGDAKKGQEWLHAHDKDIRYMVNRECMRLKAHYIPTENAKRTIIEFHGWHGRWDVDFSASSPELHKLGCNLLLVEQRGQGESDGNVMTFGIKEKFDVQDWINWYQKEIDDQIPIYLGGVSMGAATLLMASSFKFPKEVKAIFSDCGFSNAYEIIRLVGKNYFHVPEHPFMDSILRACQKKYGFDLKDGDALAAVRKATIPILFVHGTADKFVPCFMGETAFAACNAPKDLLLVEGAVHGRSFLVDKKAYMEKMQEYFENYDS